MRAVKDHLAAPFGESGERWKRIMPCASLDNDIRVFVWCALRRKDSRDLFSCAADLFSDVEGEIKYSFLVRARIVLPILAFYL